MTDRDRDDTGRARNARPRDGLGRPLPYDAVGVARQPEGLRRSPEQSLAEAQRFLDAGMPFHAHEILEDAWKSAEESEVPLWKGLAQLAVGATHAARGNAGGASTLLRRGAEGIRPFENGTAYGIDVGGLVRWANQFADVLDRDPDAGHLPVPRLVVDRSRFSGED